MLGCFLNFNEGIGTQYSTPFSVHPPLPQRSLSFGEGDVDAWLFSSLYGRLLAHYATATINYSMSRPNSPSGAGASAGLPCVSSLVVASGQLTCVPSLGMKDVMEANTSRSHTVGRV